MAVRMFIAVSNNIVHAVTPVELDTRTLISSKMAGLAVVPALVFAGASVAGWGITYKLCRENVKADSKSDGGFSILAAVGSVATFGATYQAQRVALTKLLPAPTDKAPPVTSLRDFAKIVGPRTIGLYVAVTPACALAGVAYGLLE
ncbi:hypothetical protein SARC_04387 [Sphaeroforma arctica JP610]|uniref:Uncharacterized protein n=1 Tax=Sphaeroforma arctica JP610 TaxID=667725 RepID=A0A0L0G3D6_9EUKA|nr:hypothetical protein SARC_04387 [Sphaeroforma arctica JP610]KNC83356.1 hypothetical protein SARC_04387 [Sphaeroforma arctica JP610]|eukprot:XP_014157258.1 hypothetical protein SARC_04387 [Sphaeroforma arctica JP610]